MFRTIVRLFLLLPVLAIWMPAHGLAVPPEIPVKGMVTVLDIGREGCAPCKMMLTVLREMEEQYKGKAAIVLLDMVKDKDLSNQFRPRVAPTQIFFDREGMEVSRHEGFMDKKTLGETLEKLGVGR